MLIIMKDGDLHALTKFALDQEAIGSLDVLEVNSAKGWFQGGNHLNQFLGIAFVDFNIKHINPCKLFKEYRFALHDRLTGECANITQTQHSRTVGDYPN